MAVRGVPTLGELSPLYMTKFYRAWQNLKTRCDNPKATLYEQWGGRGISYDPKWKTFRGFYEDMYKGYTEGLSLDRIDNDKNYSKSNCKWATAKEQANNTRRNFTIKYRGETKNLIEWAEITGIERRTIRARIARGWSIRKALLTPPNNNWKGWMVS